ETTRAPRATAARMRATAASRLAAGSASMRICTRPIEKRAGAAIGGDSAQRAAGCQRERRPRGAGIAGGDRSRMPRMDMSYTPEGEAFRARGRAGLEGNGPAPRARADAREGPA